MIRRLVFVLLICGTGTAVLAMTGHLGAAVAAEAGVFLGAIWGACE